MIMKIFAHSSELSRELSRELSGELPNVYNGVLDAAVQEQEIWQIAALLPHTTVHDIRQKLLSLASDQRFVMNYWLKVCKLRAFRGQPMPWDQIH
jgi:hypothetical protein